jgi:tetrahydromethanopterin S-methyltransferase subunit G
VVSENYVTKDEYQSIEKRVSSLERSHDVLKNRVDNIDKKLDKIDNNTTWILRLIIGAFITSLLGLVLIQGGVLS